jgi:hypothetical protein
MGHRRISSYRTYFRLAATQFAGSDHPFAAQMRDALRDARWG